MGTGIQQREKSSLEDLQRLPGEWESWARSQERIGFRWEEGEHFGWKEEDGKVRLVIVPIMERKANTRCDMIVSEFVLSLTKSTSASTSGGIHSQRTGSQNANHGSLYFHSYGLVF